MMFFEIFGTVTLPVPLKNWMLIPLREMYVLSKFGKRSSSTSRSMTDKQNRMTMSILYHQHLRRIALRHFTKRCICCLSFKTVPPLEKRSTWLSKSRDYLPNVSITCGGVFLWRIFYSDLVSGYSSTFWQNHSMDLHSGFFEKIFLQVL